MDSQTVLDRVIFQLTPTRTRYDLFVVAKGVTERMTSGLLTPFLSHLQAAEEQLAKGGYSIELEPPAHSKAPWFTKGTVERFVRFVSSPEVIERGNTVEMELMQLEETIKMQTLMSARVEDPPLDDSSSICLLGEKSSSLFGKPRLLKKMRQGPMDGDSGAGTNSKKQLLRALEARHLVLQKEQGMAFARAAAAGFELVPLLQLIMFAECFGAARLREACCNFVALCKKAQITGFCIGDLKLIDQDISWALSNFACVSILKSMEAVSSKEENTVPSKREADCSVPKDRELADGAIGFKHSSIEQPYQQQLPSSHAHLSPSSGFFEWSNAAAVYQGWPAMYTDRNGSCGTFNGYHYGYSPGSQQSFTTLSDMSPSVTGSFCYSTGVASQLPSVVQGNGQTSSSQDISSFPSLKKLQIGHRGKKKSKMAVQDVKRYESFPHGYGKGSSEVTDSSPETSDSSKPASVVSQDDYASKDGWKEGLSTTAGFRKNWNGVAEVGSASELSDSFEEITVASFRVPSSGDASLALIPDKDVPRLGGSYALHPSYEATSSVQKSHKSLSDDNSLLLFEQCREDSLGSRSKKRLDFQEPETHHKQKQAGEVDVIDDSFFVHSPSGIQEHKIKPAIESEVQGNQIYAKMSKQALKVNSVVSTRRDADDLLMLPRQLNRDSSRNSSDVLNIDVELRGSAARASLLNSQKPLTDSEPSQERVKKFLDQYNEKREAKLRGDASSSKRAEREGKLKALKEDLDKSKSDLIKARRPERSRLQAEAQLRADKLRMYKADLQKSKKEKEEEERRRLEELKAQRQSKIAARSNLVGRSNGSSFNPRGKIGSQPSTSKPSPAASRLSAIHKSTTSSTQMARHSKEHASRSAPRAASGQQMRSSISSVPRQTRKASIDSQPSRKSETLKNPQRTTSPPLKSSRVFSAVFSKDMQIGSTRKRENSTVASKKQGFLPGSHSGFSSDKSRKILLAKEMPKGADENKQERRPFLKKGSGAGASSRSIQKMKPTSPNRAMTVGKRPPFMVGTEASRPDSKQRNKVKVSGADSGFATSRSTVLKSRSSTPPATNGGSTMGTNKMILAKSTLKGSWADSAMSRLMLFDTSCTTNGELNMHSTDAHGLDLMSNGVFPKSSATDSPLTSCKQQSNGSKNPSSLRQMSMHVTMLEDYEAEGGAHDGKRLSYKAPSNHLNEHSESVISLNGLGKLPQTSKTPAAAGAYRRETISSGPKGSITKASQPFSFSGTLRSKAAEAKWH